MKDVKNLLIGIIGALIVSEVIRQYETWIGYFLYSAIFLAFCLNIFMGAFTRWGTRDFGPILKDERRTSNIQRPTSNEKQTSNTEHSTAIYDSHRMLKQPFFKVISLFLHLFPFNIRCWTFDVRCS